MWSIDIYIGYDASMHYYVFNVVEVVSLGNH